MKAIRLALVSSVMAELAVLCLIAYFYQSSLKSSSTSWKHNGQFPFTFVPGTNKWKQRLENILNSAAKHVDQFTWPIQITVGLASKEFFCDDDDTFVANMTHGIVEALSLIHVADIHSTERFRFSSRILHPPVLTHESSCDQLNLSDWIQGDEGVASAQGNEMYVFFAFGCSNRTIPKDSFAAVDVDTHGHVLVRWPDFEDPHLHAATMHAFIQGPLTRLMYQQLVLSNSASQIDRRVVDTSKLHFHFTLTGDLYHAPPPAINSTVNKVYFQHKLASFQNQLEHTLKPMIDKMLGQVFDVQTFFHVSHNPSSLSAYNIPLRKENNMDSQQVYYSIPFTQLNSRRLLDALNLKSRNIHDDTQTWNFVLYLPTADESPLDIGNSLHDHVAIYIANLHNDVSLLGSYNDAFTHVLLELQSYFGSFIRTIVHLPTL